MDCEELFLATALKLTDYHGIEDLDGAFTDSCAMKFKFFHVIEKRDGHQPEGLA
jgi:hypothetical protein